MPFVSGNSFDLLLSASSANGKLRPFVKKLIKCNQQSQVPILQSCITAPGVDLQLQR
jgi:hypothetical protein